MDIRRPMSVIVSAVIVLLAFVAGHTQRAEAASIAGAITKVTTSPQSVPVGGQVTSNIDWRVPDGAHAGDTFTLTLDRRLTSLPPSFDIKDPAGNVIAKATITDTVPAVITFTLTDYAARHTNTSGTAFVMSTLSAAPGDQTLVNTGGDGNTWKSQVTVTSTSAPRTHAQKYGVWTGRDQGRTNNNGFLKWTLETRTGPFDSAVLADTAQSPQTIDCGSVLVQKGDTTGANGGFNHAVAFNGAVTCSKGAISVALGAAAAGELYRVTFSVSLPAPTGVGTPPRTFSNTAAETVKTVNGTKSYQPSASVTQSSAGGQGGGTTPTPGISITKDDSAGHAADTEADATSLPSGTTGLVYTITNKGAEALKSVVVGDTVVSNGTVTSLICSFPDGSKGIRWAGPFEVGAHFTCTATLSGVQSGTVHQDVATVEGQGSVSGTKVTDKNPYFAHRSPSVRVGDYVWIDNNHNGIQEPGEPGIPGVSLTVATPDGQPVTDVTGKPVGPTKTDGSGKYLFEELPPGQYVVHLDGTTVPAALVSTLSGQGARELDSSTGSATSTVLAGGEQDLTLDFGFYYEQVNNPPAPPSTPSTPSTPQPRTPVTSTPPSSTPVPSTPVTAHNTVTRSLPNTGTATELTLAFGLLLLGLGTMLLVGVQRPRRQRH
ncbi:Ig-like domain-containing protein [Jatrophihabitans telluris]|uniref:Ig-like domain-containing protein n=1 Tax=Jatrophihabitans telluris TaxID=2038343 RepID=A0ABY4QWV1_9ACTN|nr:SdrD B-like domain-containing protein [Jatrophihabitans telluris]UQX87597.1 Ig-like domain-containing protein [Jatrophihabitans telluris]